MIFYRLALQQYCSSPLQAMLAGFSFFNMVKIWKLLWNTTIKKNNKCEDVHTHHNKFIGNSSDM